MCRIRVFVLFTVICFLYSCAQPGKSAQNANNADLNQEESVETQELVNVDCEQLMHDLAQDCFTVSSVDENNQPLPESELQWLSDYCECYAQLSFQTYGCIAVSEHQSLSEEEFQSTYANIFSECEIQQSMLIQSQEEAAAAAEAGAEAETTTACSDGSCLEDSAEGQKTPEP